MDSLSLIITCRATCEIKRNHVLLQCYLITLVFRPSYLAGGIFQLFFHEDTFNGTSFWAIENLARPLPVSSPFFPLLPTGRCLSVTAIIYCTSFVSLLSYLEKRSVSIASISRRITWLPSTLPTLSPDLLPLNDASHSSCLRSVMTLDSYRPGTIP